MKNSRSVLFALAFLMITSLGFANTNDATKVSGTYDGTLETKTILTNSDKDQTSATTESGIEFLFNGDVFIYQGKNAKAMGNYELAGNRIIFTVNSVKGDEATVDAIFNQEYTYSKSGRNLMLIGKSTENSNIMVYRLNKK